MKIRPVHVLALVSLATAAFAQSIPRGAAAVTLGGKKVAIDYGRPTLKGRTIDDLTTKLPEDRIWRAGENQVTTLTTETDLVIGGKTVPAGKYSLYVYAPATGDWSLVVNSDLGIALVKIYAQAPDNVKNEPWPHLEGYKNILGTEVARVPMKSAPGTAPTDAFTMSLASASGGATLTMVWGDRSWSIDIKAVKK